MKLQRILSLSLVLVFMVMAAPVGPAAAQKVKVDPQRLEAAKNLLQISGAAKSFDAIIPLMMKQLKALFKKQHRRHGEFIDEVFKRIELRFGNRKQELIDQVAMVYAKEMTAAEMNELSAFYSSGVGARFVSLQPKLIKASSGLGRAWGRRIGQEILLEVQLEMRNRGIAK